MSEINKLSKVEQMRASVLALVAQTKTLAKKKKMKVVNLEDLPPLEIPETYHLVTNKEELGIMVKDLLASSMIAIDTETTGLNFMRDILVGASFRSESGQSYYVPLKHNKEIFPVQLSYEEFAEGIKEVLTSDKILKILHNLSFDYRFIRRHLGVAMVEPVADTYVFQHVIDENELNKSLKPLAQKYLGIDCSKFDELFGAYADYREVPHDWAFYYAAKDADITYLLYEFLLSRLQEDKAVSHVLFDIEFPLLIPVAEMTYNGVYLEADELLGLTDEINNDISDLKKEFEEGVVQMYLKLPDNQGEDFIRDELMTLNYSSTKQMSNLIYDILKIPPIKRFGKSLNAKAVSNLENKYPIIHSISAYKKLEKLLTSFIYTLPTFRESNGKIYPDFNQVGTATARFSSSKPNAQQISSKGKYANAVRGAFKPREGYKFLDADYSQIELRVLAHISQEPKLIEAFNKGIDLHKLSAAQGLNKPVEEITAEERAKIGKVFNFGIDNAVLGQRCRSPKIISTELSGEAYSCLRVC